MKATKINWTKWFRRELIVMFTLYFFCANMAFANPYGAQVVNGNVSINTQGNNLTVTNSPNSIINWQGFSIASNEAVRFIQQSSQSAVLNRVISQNPSAILGALQSNGRVFLINPNGILFGQGAQVNVNGLVASTLNISNQDFLAGKYNFTAGTVAGAIQNQGTITTPNGGQVYLIAPNVENSGIINTPKGDVILAAGYNVQLVDSFNPDISVVVSAPENQAVNLGQIMAQSGKIGIYGGLISQKGIVSADSAVVGENGKIFFKATKDVTLDAGSITSANGIKGGEIKIQSETGTTMVSGTVTAIGNIPAPSTGEGEGGGVGKGGDIQILGQHVGLIDNAKIDASGKTGGGTVLIGGDYQGKNSAVSNATATYVGKNAVIKADATETGDGGKVIVWSDKATRVYGIISAKGGLLSGNGGLIETSSKQYLDVTQAADASAPNGNAGTWLLDPNNITIVAGAFGTPINLVESPAGVFSTNNDGAQITNGTITQALNAGTSVSLTTGTAGSNLEAGDITINASISKFTGGNTSLTLSAANNININQSITSTVGKLDLNLTPTAGATNLGAVTIDLFGGTMTATTGTGTVNFSSGTATINSTANIGTLNVQGGTLSLNSSGNSIASLNLTGGTLTGSGALTLSGASTWTGGTISVGGSGGVTVLSSATLSLSGNNNKILGGGNLTIAGQADWVGSGNLYLNDAGQFTIQSGGLFDIKTDADIYYTSGAPPTFTNAGMLRKSASAAETFISASSQFNFVNSGTLDAQTGILHFLGNNTFNNGSTFTGAGINRITTGAAFSGAITSANLDLAGGIFSGTATLSGATNWSGGTIGGNAVLTIPSSSALNMVNSGNVFISNATLIDQGTITWTGAGNLYLNDAGQFTIQSGGLFDIKTDADIYYTSGGAPTFTNAGILRKSAGTDVTVIGASSPLTFNNAGGAIDVTSGYLQLNAAASFSGSTNITGRTVQFTSGGGSITGSLNIGSGATIDFASGTTSFTGTTDFTGSGSLLLSGATWSGSGNVNVSSPMTWTGGTISVGGSGGVTVLSSATLSLSGNNNKILGGGNLTIAGQADWVGSGNLYLNDAGQFTIQSGGLFDIKTDADIYYTSGAPPTFTNAGMLRKSASAAETFISASSQFNFVNSGTLDAQTGILHFLGNNTFNNGSTFTGAGINRITTGAAFSGAITSANLDLAGGIFSGTATLSGATNWSGGTIGGNAVLTIPSSSALNMVNSGNVFISNATLIDQGTITWTGAGNLYLNDAGQFTIQSGGLFDIKTDADIYYTSGGAPTFTNAGILRKSASAAETLISASSQFNFVNSGTLDAQTGILHFLGNNTFNNGSTFTGAGINRITTGAAFSGAITSANLDLAGGIFSGTATLSGATNWSGGTIGGNAVLTIPSSSALNMVNSGNVTISNATLIDQGTITWTGAGNLYLNDAGQFTIQSGGLFDIKTDADIYYTSGAPPTFTNAGILRKSAGTDLTVIGASNPFSVNNSGAIDVLTGTIDVTGTFSATGTIETISSATFKKTGGFINAGTISGMGTIDVGAGNTLTNNGTINPGGAGMVGSLAITGNLVQGSSGIINIDIAGTTPGMLYDQLTISGSATLNGTLNIAHVSEYTPSGGETFNVINSAGNTGSFVTINPPASFTYTPTYGATVFGLAFSSGSGTDTWLLNADGSWDVADNWSLGAVPVAGQNVIVDCPSSLCTVTIPGAYSAVAGKIISNESLTIAGGSLSLTAGAYSSLFGSGTTLSLTGGGTITIGSGATLTAYNLTLASGDISGPGSLTVSNSFSQSTGGTIGNTTPVSTLNITQAAGNLVIADLLKASGNISLTAYATTTQTGAIKGAGLELLGAGGTYNLNTADNEVTTLAGNTGSVNFTNITGLSIGTVNGTTGLTTTGNTQLFSGGDLTLSGLIDAGAGTVLLSAVGAIINGMESSNSIAASALVAVAQTGIGSGNPLMTSVQMLSAVNTTINDIAIDNTGVLAVIGLSNEGSTGNVILSNIGAITTSELTVTSAGGNVSIIAHSPLTIGSGGVSASGDIALEAAASGGSDGLTINGSIASANGNIALAAGSSIVLGPGAVLSAPHGTIILTDQLNGAGDSAVTGNSTATSNTANAFQSALESITDTDSKEEEERKKKIEGGGKDTDEKKTDSKDKKYCN